VGRARARRCFLQRSTLVAAAASSGACGLWEGGSGGFPDPDMAAAICAEDDAPRAAAECAGGSIERLDLGGGGDDAKAAALKRSVYLMDCAPVWGSAATRGRSTEMEDACAAAPRFADVPVRLLASRRDLDGLGIDAGELRLPAHLVAVYDGHGGAQVGLGHLETLCPVAAPCPHDLTILNFVLLFRWPTIAGKGSTFSWVRS
jgi:hypothetical protein